MSTLPLVIERMHDLVQRPEFVDWCVKMVDKWVHHHAAHRDRQIVHDPDDESKITWQTVRKCTRLMPKEMLPLPAGGFTTDSRCALLASIWDTLSPYSDKYPIGANLKSPKKDVTFYTILLARHVRDFCRTVGFSRQVVTALLAEVDAMVLDFEEAK